MNSLHAALLRGLLPVVLGASMFAAGCASVPQAAPVPPSVLALKAPAADVDPGKQLHALFDSEWQRHLLESPEDASAQGDHRYDDRWSDTSPAAVARSNEGDVTALKQLLEIDREKLSAADQLNFDLFRDQLQTRIEGARFHIEQIPVSQRGGIQSASEMAEILPFATAKDYENWIARLRALGTAVDQTIDEMKLGIAEQRMPPKPTMQRVPAQIDKQRVKKPEESPFYAPFKTMPKDIPADQQAQLQADAKAAIRDTVIPAYDRFKTFFVKDYLPACATSIAATDLPDGRDYYAWLVRYHTTTDLTPDQIHEIGLKEVARLDGEIAQLKKQLKFKGDTQAFFRYLRTDKRFFHKNGDELLASYRVIAKRIDGELPKLFGKLPRLPYGVRPIPMTTAPDTTTAYYQPGAADGSRAGFYYVNLYKPETRPTWEQEALTAHESVPGHHLQISLQQELGELPDFRRQAGYTAYVEGWALYAESLGGDVGLYQDPYSKFGQLTYEMWRAVRLVVDTGMHAKGWSRERAVKYFRDHAAKTPLDIDNEIDRYISMPGQALAYKIGELKIKELRARATAKLGPKFDVRAFHDRVLSRGAVPLDLLEQDIDRWIAEQARS
jgi:uncharacterized protein (DUF885 family)